MSQPKIRILCLHGFCSTAKHLEGGLKGLQKHLANASPIELHFLQSPHALPIPDDARQRANKLGLGLDYVQRYSWWRASDDGTEYRGWKESVSYVKEYMKNSGPFHGILGFSQGAAMAAVLCASMQQTNELSFVILIGGFPPRDTDLQKLISESSTLKQIRSLHVIGEADEVVKPEVSRKLAQAFCSPSFMLHSGGHYIPTSRSYCDIIVEFVLQSSKL